MYARYFPVLAISEVKTILKSSGENYKEGFGAGEGYYGPDGSHGHAHHEAQEEVVENTQHEESTVELSEEELAQNKSTLLDRIGTADASEADDLKQISGVGPVLEKTLNSIGIYKFEQVSKMTSEEYNLLDSLTKSFPGRAERDNWAAQATELMTK